MGLPQYKSKEYTVERVYFAGTDTLRTGQPLCYQESPSTASVTTGFTFDVEIPNSTNRGLFAGVVPPDQDGVVGPAYINILVPQKGDIMQVLVSRAADVAVGAILKLNNDIGTTTSDLGGFDALAASTVATSVAGSISAVVFKELPALNVALESVASTSTDSARSLVYVRFL